MASKEYISELTEVHILEFLLHYEGQTAELNMKLTFKILKKLMVIAVLILLNDTQYFYTHLTSLHYNFRLSSHVKRGDNFQMCQQKW